ncbi:RluA family pseudouridine synthase [Solitalea koreensis]|uniref:23S rRNA pseudouridine1911/1915/1917 synthase n=1 Tax=Solitalea koreensis TaxID=543615 RepID=A0A521DKK1_9SPHI|nr:RluA family pseudouridine synthase [Solitalea koreensis]SMO71621.1 23S rRNA pseudouridine1911/1915/1917 synthase [Solitalea koreensis]
MSFASDFNYKDLEILYEDNHIIAVNKPSGIPVQGDISGDKPLIDHVKDYIKYTFNKPGEAFAGLIHRIDRPVSGVILFARTSKALERFNALFKSRDIHKTYWALVKNQPPKPEGNLINYLKKNQEKNTSKAYDTEVPGSSRSELNYKVIGKSDSYYLIEVDPITGRHHQIRVQLSNIGCPIRGDKKYGYQRSNPDLSINLHARKINFIHPVKKEEMTITAPLPKDPIWQLFGDVVS